jgi:serine/threonine-protein kinase
MTRRCPSCSNQVPDASRFCPACGTALGSSDSGTHPTDLVPASAAGPESPWTSSADDGRFAAGTILADRYRVIGLLGRGGMGEVYRADDLKLGRPVAIKLLPESMERNVDRLSRLLNEVRTAVRVTHPNVCRVHDIGVFAGRHYLTMEYIDGEDLGTLLRRIGRLPADRALRAARQLCSGLAAAHAQGVLHRDLKPANVMIDGRGDVKITDFGLAGAVGQIEGAEIRAGTPAYMSPEQLAGREVTERSDVYALGLVLYELFSGKPAFADRTPEAIARRSESTPSSLTSLVDDVDPSVARIVDRCLASDPRDRPATPVAVAAALPGGDPLAAVLAAGETPSPELLAEAGASEGLKPLTAVVLLAAVIVGLLVVAGLQTRTALVSRAEFDRSPPVLRDRAQEIVRAAGWGSETLDAVHEWVPNRDYYRAIRTGGSDPSRWDRLSRLRPPALLFAYRESPRLLRRLGAGSVGEWMSDPPPTTPGMVEVRLSPAGKLQSFRAIPEPRGAAPSVSGERREEPPEQLFAALFEAAGLDAQVLERVEPELSPASFAERRHAWKGRYPEDPDVEIRVEAASLASRPVSFEIVEPWAAEPVDSAEAVSGWSRASQILESVWFVVAVVGAALVAARNIRLGRGDHRTALRFGLYLASLRLLWMLGAHHRAGLEVDLLRGHLAWSAFRLCLSYVFYMALEPYARRLWPEMLVSWVRAFGGRLRDARVGRDVLLGVACGIAIAVTKSGSGWLGLFSGGTSGGLGTEFWGWESLRGLGSAITGLAALHITSVLDTLIGVMLFLVLRVVTRDTRVAVGITSFLALLLFSPAEGLAWYYLLAFAVVITLFWVALFRAGLLALLTAFTVESLMMSTRVSLDLAAWHSLPMWLAYGSVLAIALWSFRTTLAGRPLFRDEIQRG